VALTNVDLRAIALIYSDSDHDMTLLDTLERKGVNAAVQARGGAGPTAPSGHWDTVPGIPCCVGYRAGRYHAVRDTVPGDTMP
jgi:hypothetical protein